MFKSSCFQNISRDFFKPVTRNTQLATRFKIFFVLSVCAFLTLVYLPGKSFASSVSVVATVDKNEATLEDYIQLRLSVKGIREEPVFPEMPEFKVQSRGTSSKVSIVNGQMSSSVEYSYILYPQKTGSFTIGPFLVKYKGKTVKSNQIAVNIRKSRPQEKNSRDIFVTAEVDNDKPYLYEEIIYCLKFYRKVKVANAQLTESPSFEGFISEHIGKDKEYQKIINGQTYLVNEITQALFPVKTGVLEISSSTLYCDVVVQSRRQRRGFFSDPFFSRAETVPKSFATSPITVMVKPLPAEGRPAGFKNLVGEFELSSELSSSKLEVGESLTLTLSLTGTGNLKNHQTIDISGLQNFKVYDDKPVFEPLVSGGKVGGKLTVKKAMVPLTEGRLRIPPITVSYFNPSSGSYETVKTGPFTLDVLPSADKEKFRVVESVNSAGAKEEVKIIGHDILPIHTSLDSLATGKLQSISFFTIMGFLLPVFGFLSCLIIKRVRENNEEDSGLIRAKSAYKNFNKKLPIIKNTLKKDESLYYETASKAFKDFIGDKLNIAGNALTSGELEVRLVSAGVSAGVSEETVGELKNIIDFFESGRFGFKKYSFDEKAEVLNSMIKLAKKLNKKLKK